MTLGNEFLDSVIIIPASSLSNEVLDLNAAIPSSSLGNEFEDLIAFSLVPISVLSNEFEDINTVTNTVTSDYTLLGIPFEFDLPRQCTINVLDSSMGVGRSVRRQKSYRAIKNYTLNFKVLTKCELDILLALFDELFTINTPDDGFVNVMFKQDTLNISQISNVLFQITVQVEEFL